MCLGGLLDFWEDNVSDLLSSLAIWLDVPVMTQMEEVWVLNEYGEQTPPAPPGLSAHHWLQGGQETNPWCI